MPSVKEQFLNTVQEQIRWKRARGPLTAELVDHLDDKTHALMNDGLDQETAERWAVQEMGDPVVVGQELDAAHRPKPSWSMVLLTIALSLLGVLLRDSLGVGSSLVALAIGGGLLVVAYLLDFTILARHWLKILVALLIVGFLLLVFNPAGMQFISGRVLSLQYLYLLFPLVLAGMIYAMRGRGLSGLVWCIVATIALSIFGLTGATLSSLLLFGICAVVLLTMAVICQWFGCSKKAGLLVIYCCLAAVIVLATVTMLQSEYRLARFMAFVNPQADPMGNGYLYHIVREFVAGAQLLSGTSVDLNLLPKTELGTDFLLTYVLIIYGWLAFLGIVAVLGVFLTRAFVLCVRQKSVLGRLVAVAVITTLCVQVALYILANLGLGLFSPLTLPLLSYGGTGIVMNLFLIGVLLSVFKGDEIVRDQAAPLVNTKKHIIWQNGKLVIDFNK